MTCATEPRFYFRLQWESDTGQPAQQASAKTQDNQLSKPTLTTWQWKSNPGQPAQQASAYHTTVEIKPKTASSAGQRLPHGSGIEPRTASSASQRLPHGSGNQTQDSQLSKTAPTTSPAVTTRRNRSFYKPNYRIRQT